jgi:hypothetical protein
VKETERIWTHAGRRQLTDNERGAIDELLGSLMRTLERRLPGELECVGASFDFARSSSTPTTDASAAAGRVPE